ncbi:unnamed protein product [Rotaria magnacalcarata]
MSIYIIIVIIIFLLIYYNKRNNIEIDAIEYVRDGCYPIIGNLFSLIKNRTQFLKNSREIYGDCFKVKLLNQTIIFILNPFDWINIIKNRSLQFMGEQFSRTIFDLDHNFFGKSQLDTELQGYFTQYLKCSNGLEKLNIALIEEMILFIKKEKNDLNEKQMEWRNIGLFEFCSKFLINSITKTLFGNVELEFIERNYRNFDSNIQYLFLLFPKWIYQLFFRNLLKSRYYLNKYWLSSIHEYNESDLIRDRTNLMMKNSDWFSSKDYAGEKTFLLWSSLTNTIPTLFWSLLYILKDEFIFEKVFNEINEHFPKEFFNNIQHISFNDNILHDKLICCIYLESIINESLRLYSNPMIMRKSIKNFEFTLYDKRKIFIKKNSIIALYPNIAQNDSNYFTSPNKFIFDRFINKMGENSHGFLPFGSGKSMCPGRLFAKSVIKISIIIFLQFIHYKLNLLENKIPNEKTHRYGVGVSHPEKDIQILLKF